ncbi:MAG: threonine/serine dehydratase [Pseudomonadota bacterium]
MTAPTISDIEAAAESLAGRIVATPTIELNSSRIVSHLPKGARVHMKMELFQQAGSFKSRGVLLAIDAMSDAEKAAGVTAVSAGNHALAVSWGACEAGLSAKVVMPKTADPLRVELCHKLGAEVVLTDNVSDAFKEVQRLVETEGRTMLHPFESPHMTLGAATCGLEFARAVPDMNIAIVPVGGGGLISGMALAIKQALPDCEIIGVEPFGADSMFRSFETGEPVTLDKVDTIADSLGAPMAMPDSYALTRAHVSRIVRLEDDALRDAMRLLFHALKIVPEPACAATTAALTGPLAEHCRGKTVGIIACGSNISLGKFQRLLDA